MLCTCLGCEAELLPAALQGHLGSAARAGSVRTVETAVFMQTLERLQAELRQEQVLRGQADMALAAMQAQAVQPAVSSSPAGQPPYAQAAAGKKQQQLPTDGSLWVPGRPSHAQTGDGGQRLQAAAGGAREAGQPALHARAGKSVPGQLCPQPQAAASGDAAGEDQPAAGGREVGSDCTAAAAVLAAHSDAGHLTAPADGQASSVAATLGSVSPVRYSRKSQVSA